VQVDSISVMNAAVVYGEQIISGKPPAVITIGDLHLSVKGITNRRSIASSISIRAGGSFMNTAAMDLFMLIPVESPTFSYRFAGTVNFFDLRLLNRFLETAELIRITQGSLQIATFDIAVNNGSAQGNVRAFYKDLSLASLSKTTGEEENMISGFTMFLANAFVIRGSNIPDRNGVIKVGKVGYAKKKGEAFLEYTWFALRSGLKDVVGF
ncbi:MAG: hypothetical protein KA247_01845, partial [Bacteroidetes bacterium]|nr:hypothetical protein [Bacteroidota bacterium]